VKNFKLLEFDFDAGPLLEELADKEHLWNQNDIRTKGNSFHKEADDILLIFDIDEEDNKGCYPASGELEKLGDFVYNFLEHLGYTEDDAVLGRMVLTRLKPGKVIYPHIDLKDHTDAYNRYHLCLTDADSIFMCGDEVLNELGGTAFWFDNSLMHSVQNKGDSDRIHLIVDIAKHD